MSRRDNALKRGEHEQMRLGRWTIFWHWYDGPYLHVVRDMNSPIPHGENGRDSFVVHRREVERFLDSLHAKSKEDDAR